MTKKTHIRKPEWIRVKTFSGQSYNKTSNIVHSHKLNTICEAAMCPNKGECWHHGTATFLLLGEVCTRSCTFCAVKGGKPEKPDPNEPALVADSVEQMKLKHVVLTSVTRDDLDDGGASHIAETVNQIKNSNPQTTVEILIPDFRGDWDSLAKVMQADIAILNHNLETVPRLYAEVRPAAKYPRSLELLRRAGDIKPDIATKSGVMVGLGEEKEEMVKLMHDLREVGCSILTIGQYLQPSLKHYPVIEYIHPDVFEEYRALGLKMGFKHVESAPFVRSSYNAWKHV
jgi:lipoyl synthase